MTAGCARARRGNGDDRAARTPGLRCSVVRAPGRGLEPRSGGSKPPVVPLDHPGSTRGGTPHRELEALLSWLGKQRLCRVARDRHGQFGVVIPEPRRTPNVAVPPGDLLVLALEIALQRTHQLARFVQCQHDPGVARVRTVVFELEVHLQELSTLDGGQRRSFGSTADWSGLGLGRPRTLPGGIGKGAATPQARRTDRRLTPMRPK
jgi:hypothetical protein